eukprot:360874-Chlamydomonas_euryale.AAC.5
MLDCRLTERPWQKWRQQPFAAVFVYSWPESQCSQISAAGMAAIAVLAVSCSMEARCAAAYTSAPLQRAPPHHGQRPAVAGPAQTEATAPYLLHQQHAHCGPRVPVLTERPVTRPSQPRWLQQEHPGYGAGHSSAVAAAAGCCAHDATSHSARQHHVARDLLHRAATLSRHHRHHLWCDCVRHSYQSLALTSHIVQL